jgi:glycosyltransferase involved in cell wall biosynthesis
MKVAMISDYFPKYGAKVVQNIIQYSQNFDVDFFVISSTYDQLGNKIQAGVSYDLGVKVYRLKSFAIECSGTPYVIPYQYLTAIEEIISVEKPDILHIHFPVCLGSWIALHIGKKCGIPVVLTLHGISEGYSDKKLALIAKIMKIPVKYCLQNSDIITAISQLTKEYHEKEYALEHDIVLIPNGVDLDLFKPIQPLPKEAFKWIDSNFIKIGFVGHVRHAKGLHFLVQSANEIIKQSPQNILFIIGGEGPMRQDLMQMVSDRGLEDNFLFPGYIPDESLSYYLNSLDIFVQPSLVEGMPQGVLEAMACGKPIVATDVGGVSEIVDNGVNGYLIDPGSPEQLCNAVVKLVEDANMRRIFGENSQKIVEEKFDWGVLCVKYYNLYTSIISSK